MEEIFKAWQSGSLSATDANAKAKIRLGRKKIRVADDQS